jgi:hypothetical protein
MDPFSEGKVDGRSSRPFFAALSERVSYASSSMAVTKQKASEKPEL